MTRRPRSKRFVACIFGAMACFVGSAHCQDRLGILSQCAKVASHVEQRECLRRAAAASDEVLANAERRLSAKLGSADQDALPKRTAITAAQADAKEFIRYASKHCESFAALAFGGNSQSDRRLACRAELNHSRAQQLAAMAEAVR